MLLGPRKVTGKPLPHLPHWLEVHVDDEILERRPDQWLYARSLVATLASIAEDRGARLSFRFRLAFAQLAKTDGIMAELTDRGHEVGAHAHGQGLAAVTEALRAAGVPSVVAAPGLVQGGARSRETILRQAASLGYALVTDHGPDRAWAYEGLAPRAEVGLVTMAPTILPFDWGLLGRGGQRHGIQANNLQRLRELELRAADLGALYFGAVFHEHDVCEPDSLRPRPEALDALRGFLDERFRPSSQVPRPPTAHVVNPTPLSDRRVRVGRALSRITPAFPGLRSLHLHRPRRHSASTGPMLPVGRRAITVQRFGPQEPSGIVVSSITGDEGGTSAALKPFGLAIDDLTENGWAVLLYDRAGTGRSAAAGPLTPGNPAHTDDFRAVLGVARLQGVPVVALTWSAALVVAMRAAAAGDSADALVDVEGPIDRWSLVPPTRNELSGVDPWDDEPWKGLEALRMAGVWQRPYARVQAQHDHVHGLMNEHAHRMVAAMKAGEAPVFFEGIQPGKIQENPGAVVRALAWAFTRVRT